MDYVIRHMHETEYPFLEEFLYQAIYVPEDFVGEVPRDVVYDDPKCRAAYEGFGELPDDRALVAELEGEVVGACWTRTTNEYGHIDDATPSFSIAIFKEHRGQGIGTILMQNMLDNLHEAGYHRASLSVQKENPALRLYKRLGFRIVGDGADETEWLMVYELDGRTVGTAIESEIEGPVLVSACLLGETCRYDGQSRPSAAIVGLADSCELIAVCPEQLGGLPTPRTPSEIQPDGRVVDTEGADRTNAFSSGAKEALRIARENGCSYAILKENSPSCGVYHVYDGTFSNVRIPGQGKTTGLLASSGIKVYSDTDIAQQWT